MKTFLFGLIALALSVGVGLLAYQLLVQKPTDTGVTDPTTGLCSVIYGGDSLSEYGGNYTQRGAQLIDAHPLATLSGNYIGEHVNQFANHPLTNLDIAFYGAIRNAPSTFENHLINMLNQGIPVVMLTDGAQFSSGTPFSLIRKFGINIAGNSYLGVLPIAETEFTRTGLNGLTQLGFSTGAILSDAGETGAYAAQSEFTCQYTTPGNPNECVFAEVIYNGTSGPTSLFILTNIITTGHTGNARGATQAEWDAAATDFIDKILTFACTDYEYPVCNDGLDNDGDGLIDCQEGAEDPGCFPDGNGGGGECNPNDDSEEDAGVCGDGNLDDGEACDNGDQNADTSAECSTSCQLNAVCNNGLDDDGDGFVDCTTGAEDPGCFPDGRGGGGSCDVTDTSEVDTPITCGDGLLEGAEECDDGNTIDTGDLCANDCTLNPECSDGLDNDGDGLTDCTVGAADPGCFPDGLGGGTCNPADDNEIDAVAAPVGVIPSTAFGDETSHYLLLGFLLIVTGALFYKTGILNRVFKVRPYTRSKFEVMTLNDSERKVE